ncbi:MAG: alcohol dehydrogenase catalytic domain-containing protein [Clostridiales bacterium]|nr:alcohol dehydrogenase catalytic domain-containing protein [Clostridiales bacterium]
MINTVYRLVEPRRFEIAFEDIDLFSGDVIVRPTNLSICNADMRYYLGTRDAKALAEKLPMALIHEGVGRVMYDPTGEYKPGDTVVMVPNAPCEKNDYIAENYLRSSKFCGSSMDGFLQEFVSISPKRLVKLTEGIDMNVAAFTEIVSVSVHAISRFDSIAHPMRDVIGVWGDGNLGYITSLLLKYYFPDSKIIIFGTVREKLADFTFADETHLVNEVPDDFAMDHAFECVGGNGSPIAIEQIIGLIKPEATISILGVSEYPVSINTRMILEKGLRVFGSSRSGAADFKKTVDMYTKNPEIIDYLGSLISSVNVVRTTTDIKNAFEKDTQKSFGKTIMKWEE